MLSSMFTLNHPKQPGTNNVEQIPLSVGKISTEQYHLGSWQRDTRRGADKETVRQREQQCTVDVRVCGEQNKMME